jgi:hypothetical protein
MGRPEAAAPHCFPPDRLRQQIAPDQHTGKTANPATTAAETRIESTGTAASFWISRQGTEFANAIFDADQTAEKEI